MREEILADLHENKYNVNHDLMNFIVTKYDDLLVYQVREVLFQMEGDNLLILTNDQLLYRYFLNQEKLMIKNFIKPRPLCISLSAKGIKEYKEYLFSEQVKETNKAVMDASRSSLLTNESLRITNTSVRELNGETKLYYTNQKNFTIVSIIIAGLTGAFILSSVIVANNGITSADFKQTNTIFQTQVKQLDSMQKVLKGIDSSLRSMVKIDASNNAKK